MNEGAHELASFIKKVYFLDNEDDDEEVNLST